MMEESKKMYSKAKCHPWVKKNVMPVVESPLLTFPFALITWPIGIFVDCFLLINPCTCPFETIYLFFFELPVNLTFLSLMLFFVVISPFVLVFIAADLLVVFLFTLVFLPSAVVWLFYVLCVYTGCLLILP